MVRELHQRYILKDCVYSCLLACLCDVFRALINSLVRWFCWSALGLVLFHIASLNSKKSRMKCYSRRSLFFSLYFFPLKKKKKKNVHSNITDDGQLEYANKEVTTLKGFMRFLLSCRLQLCWLGKNCITKETTRPPFSVQQLWRRNNKDIQ